MAAWGKKKTLGFEKKPRTRQELEEDYGNHAFQVGHKSRILKLNSRLTKQRKNN
jgi:hypothetical protein